MKATSDDEDQKSNHFENDQDQNRISYFSNADDQDHSDKQSNEDGWQVHHFSRSNETVVLFRPQKRSFHQPASGIMT